MSGTRGRSPVLELSGVTKHYPGSPPVRALDGVDLTVDDAASSSSSSGRRGPASRR